MRWADRTGGWVDTAIVRTRRLRGAPDERIEAMPGRERLQRLAALEGTLDRPELLAFPGFLRPGPRPEVARTALRTAGGRGEHLAWESRYETWFPPSTAPEVAAPYATPGPNDTAHAVRFLAGRAPGPCAVAIHGYGAGHLRFEPLLWPVRGLLRAGIDVVTPVLPFHGPRRLRVGAPVFPAPDPRLTQEGFRQAVHDLTALLSWLRDEGHGPIGLFGLSLGGYTAALLGTLLPDLAFLTLIVPMSSIPDVALAHGRLGRGPLAEQVHAALEAVYRPTLPYSRPPKLTPDRVRIVAARGDRITGVAQAERLAAHFGGTVTTVPGSHSLHPTVPWDDLVAFARDAARR